MITQSQHSTATDIPTQLAQLIEQTLLLGKLSELDQLLAQIDNFELSSKLRYGLEALRHFRAFYAADNINLPSDKREQVIRYDAEWTMEMIKQLNPNLGFRS